MPSARISTKPKPIIVEVKPEYASNIAPATPPLPKAVRFSSSASGLVTGVSRPLSREEAWSLYNFEVHARACPACCNPQAVIRRGDRLCPEGQMLAQAAVQYVYHRNGQIYSVETQEDGKPVSVEVQVEYKQLRGLLKALDPNERASSASSNAAVINYSTRSPAYSEPLSPFLSAREAPRHREIILEPARSSSHRKTSHPPLRYAKVVVANTPFDAATASSTIRRGTLYERELKQRNKEYYEVEIREPESRKDRRLREDRWL